MGTITIPGLRPGERLTFAARELSTVELRDLLQEPLRKLKVSVPPIVTCGFLVSFCPFARVPELDAFLEPSDPHTRNFTAFGNSLEQVRKYWFEQRFLAVLRGSQSSADTLTEVALEPIARLQAAMNDCSLLMKTSPPHFEQKWTEAACKLEQVFVMAVQEARANRKKVGVDENGPAMTFIYSAMKSLDWSNGSYPTKGAVAKFLKEYRKSRNYHNGINYS